MSDLDMARHGPVLVATLNREAQMNALGSQLHEDLVEAWNGVRHDREIRAIVITGAGRRAFCTGMDLKELVGRGSFRQASDDIHQALRLTPLNCDVWLPTVVAVNGVCAGAGLHFVADADVVVASTEASFVDTHVSVGQVTAIEPVQLLHRIGLGNALRLSLLGRAGRIGAAEALRISLVDEVVEPDGLVPRAIEIAEAAAQGSPAAAEASKRAIRGALELPMAEAMQEGWRLIREHREHPDAVEGPRAFVERRPAEWGR